MERLIQIMNTKLALDRLKAEEELERVINIDLDVDSKIVLIEEQLSKLSQLNQKASIWAIYNQGPSKLEE